MFYIVGVSRVVVLCHIINSIICIVGTCYRDEGFFYLLFKQQSKNEKTNIQKTELA
ncbi:hypothetical protein SAMN04488128_1011800 [Chitinophaga eiseniae]|uniref:Uncharacterized protein n=1 Tax=Chitinophaga eiseniae TaxID=634771 RepID=A0A1T4NZ00_9BACT|nr:hypothetical protein SAMN04488128_1011800 [Chitinophaga eiseniae]